MPKNILAAAAISLTMKIDMETFQEQILSFEPPKGRCEVKHFGDITVIDDTYNANLESVIRGLQILNDYP